MFYVLLWLLYIVFHHFGNSFTYYHGFRMWPSMFNLPEARPHQKFLNFCFNLYWTNAYDYSDGMTEWTSAILSVYFVIIMISYCKDSGITISCDLGGSIFSFVANHSAACWAPPILHSWCISPYHLSLFYS